jgi:hypothetical protein
LERKVVVVAFEFGGHQLLGEGKGGGKDQKPNLLTRMGIPNKKKTGG